MFDTIAGLGVHLLLGPLAIFWVPWARYKGDITWGGVSIYFLNHIPLLRVTWWPHRAIRIGDAFPWRGSWEFGLIFGLSIGGYYLRLQPLTIHGDKSGGVSVTSLCGLEKTDSWHKGRNFLTRALRSG